MNFEVAIFLFFAGALGGGMNAVAGGGSFIAFPALLFTGVPAIPANATNTLYRIGGDDTWFSTRTEAATYGEPRMWGFELR